MARSLKLRGGAARAVAFLLSEKHADRISGRIQQKRRIIVLRPHCQGQTAPYAADPTLVTGGHVSHSPVPAVVCQPAGLVGERAQLRRRLIRIAATLHCLPADRGRFVTYGWRLPSPDRWRTVLAAYGQPGGVCCLATAYTRSNEPD